MRPRDDAVASVVGALLVIAAMGIALVYVNAFYVPRQGLTMELEARDDAEQALLDMSDRLSGEPFAFVQQLPLKATRAAPPLLEGVVLSPVRLDGVLAFHPAGAGINISYYTSPTSVFYAMGSATTTVPMGALNLTMGGAYLERATYSIEGGAVLVERDSGSSLVAPPLLQVTNVSGVTYVSWRVPIFTGDAGEVGGRESAQISLVPGPLAQAGQGQLVQRTVIVIQTTSPEAWQAALKAAVGSAWEDQVNVTGNLVTAEIGPAPCGGCPSTVAIDYSAVRYTLDVTSRSSR